MSPELIAPERFELKSSHPSEPSDCYAFGMVIYETISGHLPFHEDTDLMVVVKVLEGRRPPRGARFSKGLWGMLERCWVPQPSDRPTVGDVLRCLETLSDLPEPASPGADEGTENDRDDQDSEDGYSTVSDTSAEQSVG
jgi:serine/threonine protein kinase